FVRATKNVVAPIGFTIAKIATNVPIENARRSSTMAGGPKGGPHKNLSSALRAVVMYPVWPKGAKEGLVPVSRTSSSRSMISTVRNPRARDVRPREGGEVIPLLERDDPPLRAHREGEGHREPGGPSAGLDNRCAGQHVRLEQDRGGVLRSDHLRATLECLHAVPARRGEDEDPPAADRPSAAQGRPDLLNGQDPEPRDPGHRLCGRDEVALAPLDR